MAGTLRCVGSGRVWLSGTEEQNELEKILKTDLPDGARICAAELRGEKRLAVYSSGVNGDIRYIHFFSENSHEFLRKVQGSNSPSDKALQPQSVEYSKEDFEKAHSLIGTKRSYDGLLSVEASKVEVLEQESLVPWLM